MGSYLTDEETEPGRVKKTPRATGKARGWDTNPGSPVSRLIEGCPRTGEAGSGERLCFGRRAASGDGRPPMSQSIWQSKEVFSPLQLTCIYPSFTFLMEIKY